MSSTTSPPATAGQTGFISKRQQGQQQTVFSRLQGFLPLSPQTANPATMTRPGDSAQLAPILDPKFFKVRLLTWNMHDSLPKGELEELFGKVPVYNSSNAKPGTFPNLPDDSNHPYHLIVVAGQECPTPSGIPMGLTAGFKILDKDRDKSREFDKEHEKPASSKSKDKDRNDDSKSQKQEDELENPPSGWTSMVEDYLCHNGGSPNRTGSPSTADVGFPMPLIRQKSSKEKESRKGPYQLLIKDRLMGIYMAIYIHRDLKPLVRGMSKSAVPAGLVGGRVGNKGGVGISLNIDGTTFLFLNAHLAAHERQINHRLDNFSKIKAELSVDDFLASDDPRTVAKDVMDRFDFTFLLGDLNFRLDISRLHADWLISRQDYAQAFEFDQLNILMKQGKGFNGFQEAPINFPPTFKYDVLRTLKRAKTSRSKLFKIGDRSGHPDADEHEMEETDDGDEDMEAASLASSTVTSIVSRPTTEPGNYEDAYFYASQSLSNPGLSSATKSSAPSAKKAKAKWLALLSPSFVISPRLHKAKNSEPWGFPPTPVTATPPIPPSPLAQVANALEASSETRKRPFLRPPPMILVNSSGSQNNLQDNVILEEKGVYDSSSKKRVPSWCDRILWKTTVIQDLIPDELDDQEAPQRPRSRVGHFLANAFRPASSRSVNSNTPLATVALPGEKAMLSPPAQAPYSPTVNNRSPRGSLTKVPDPRLRRANTSFSPPPTAPLPSHYPPRRSTAFDNTRSPLSAERPQSATPSIWRFIPAFLSPTHNQGPGILDAPQSLPPSLPLKGDVICLNYDTLDDRGMRRLEGRSDHRPVIGTYAVYV